MPFSCFILQSPMSNRRVIVKGRCLCVIQHDRMSHRLSSGITTVLVKGNVSGAYVSPLSLPSILGLTDHFLARPKLSTTIQTSKPWLAPLLLPRIAKCDRTVVCNYHPGHKHKPQNFLTFSFQLMRSFN